MEAIKFKRDFVNPNLKHELRYNREFISFIRETVEKKRKRNKPSYERVYITLMNHLERFCELHNCVLYIESINEDMLDLFFTYLEELNCKTNYMAHLLTLIKAMLVRAAKFGYAVDPSYLDYEIKDVDEPFSIALSQDTIARIYYYQGLTKCQTRTRDMFIIGCTTGMRYSDYSTLTAQNLQDGYIRKVCKKTNKEVILPQHKYVKEIFAKYNGFPPARSIQNFNREIKRICKKIGLTDRVTFSYHKGGKLVTDTKEIWELVGSHTARRTALTAMFISGRFTMRQLMLISGHTSEKSLRLYLKICDADTAMSMAADPFFKG